MKALVKYAKGNGNMEIRDIPEPVVGTGQVKIEVKAAGICGSDIHIYHDTIAIPLNLPVIPHLPHISLPCYAILVLR